MAEAGPSSTTVLRCSREIGAAPENPALYRGVIARSERAE